jgi:hypothetical protein
MEEMSRVTQLLLWVIFGTAGKTMSGSEWHKDRRRL